MELIFSMFHLIMEHLMCPYWHQMGMLSVSPALLTLILAQVIFNRYRPRFFDQSTTSAYIENKHFFTKSCHRQTYPNYEQPPQSLQNLYVPYSRE